MYENILRISQSSRKECVRHPDLRRASFQKRWSRLLNLKLRQHANLKITQLKQPRGSVSWGGKKEIRQKFKIQNVCRLYFLPGTLTAPGYVRM